MKDPAKPTAKKRARRARPKTTPISAKTAPVADPALAPPPEKPKRVRKPKATPPWDSDKEAYLAKQAVLEKTKAASPIVAPPGAMPIPGAAATPKRARRAKAEKPAPPPIAKGEDERRARGRPTAFKKEFIEQARKLAALGATDREAADFFDVEERTLYRWKHQHADFCQALKVGKDLADARVEQCLYRKATGYTFDSEKVFQYEGEIVRADIVEHVPPSDTAMIFWLKNRKPGEWRDKSVLDVNVGDDLLRAIEEGNKRVADGKQT